MPAVTYAKLFELGKLDLDLVNGVTKPCLVVTEFDRLFTVLVHEAVHVDQQREGELVVDLFAFARLWLRVPERREPEGDASSTP